MLNRIVRGALVLMASVAALAAAPASAGTIITYFGWHEQWQMWIPVGHEVYNDCGVVISQSGVTTPDYSTEYRSIPC